MPGVPLPSPCKGEGSGVRVDLCPPGTHKNIFVLLLNVLFSVHSRKFADNSFGDSMKKPISYPNFLKAIHDLGIDVPVLNVEEAEDGSLTFYLYGGAVKHWPPTVTVTLAAASPTPKKTGRPPQIPGQKGER